MNVKRLRKLCIEILEIFSLRQSDNLVREKYKLNLDIPSSKQVTFDHKALKFFGPKAWNSLPYHIKSAKNLMSFKTMIKFRNRETYSCEICCKVILLLICLAENPYSGIQGY